MGFKMGFKTILKKTRLIERDADSFLCPFVLFSEYWC